MGIGVPKDLTDCGRFFAEPSQPRQRMYEALRAYFFGSSGLFVGAISVVCPPMQDPVMPSADLAAYEH